MMSEHDISNMEFWRGVVFGAGWMFVCWRLHWLLSTDAERYTESTGAK